MMLAAWETVRRVGLLSDSIDSQQKEVTLKISITFSIKTPLTFNGISNISPPKGV